MASKHASSAPAIPVPGDVLAGKYRVEQVLGQGGMGVVVAATHTLTRQRVAVKFLLPHAAGKPELVARFANEAHLTGQIQSEHVARVSDAGTLPSGSPFLVMELLDGTDLAAVLAARGPLPIDEAVRHVRQACEGLAEAHALGIVHRDLKPANLFLARRRDGSSLIKVLDFGISKLTVPGGDERGKTQSRMVMGSPLYMSPEQLIDPSDVDARADIWSLGVSLYELLTGTLPFDAVTMEGLVVKIVTGASIPLRARRPECPAALEAALARCLEKDPADRHASIAALASALAPFASPRPPERAALLESAAPFESVPAPPVACEPARRPRAPAWSAALTRHRGALLGALGAGLVLSVIGLASRRAEGPVARSNAEVAVTEAPPAPVACEPRPERPATPLCRPAASVPVVSIDDLPRVAPGTSRRPALAQRSRPTK